MGKLISSVPLPFFPQEQPLREMMGSCDVLENMKLRAYASWKTKGSEVQRRTAVKWVPWLRSNPVGSPFLCYFFLLWPLGEGAALKDAGRSQPGLSGTERVRALSIMNNRIKIAVLP